MPYYTLIHTDDLAAGAHLAGLDEDGAPPVIATDPRTLHPSEILELEDFDVAALVDGTTPVPVRLARLVPAGPVTPQVWVSSDGEEVLHGHFVQAPGWTVQAVEGLDGFLGPNAAHLTAAIRDAVTVLGDDDDEGTVRAAYDHAVNAMGEQHGSFAVWDMERAAEAALNAYGADGWWWGNAWSSCGSGFEILALAARDLIGTVPGWTPDTYRASPGPGRPPSAAPSTLTTPGRLWPPFRPARGDA